MKVIQNYSEINKNYREHAEFGAGNLRTLQTRCSMARQVKHHRRALDPPSDDSMKNKETVWAPPQLLINASSGNSNTWRCINFPVKGHSLPPIARRQKEKSSSTFRFKILALYLGTFSRTWKIGFGVWGGLPVHIQRQFRKHYFEKFRTYGLGSLKVDFRRVPAKLSDLGHIAA